MKIENKHLKSACLLAATAAYKDRHHQDPMTPEQSNQMYAGIVNDAWELYERWLGVEAEKK